GIALPVVLVLGAIILVLCMALVFLVQTESKLVNKYVEDSIAEQVAESGVEQALYYLKSHLETHKTFLEALVASSNQRIPMPEKLKTEIRNLYHGSGKFDLELKVDFESTPSPYPDLGVYTGDLRIRSRGIFENTLGRISRKQVLAVYSVKAVHMGMIAPDHALFIREKEHMNYQFEDSIEPSDLAVFKGDVYIKNGITAELSDWNKRKMIEAGELSWQEYYYMDHPSTSMGLSDGGVDFLDAENIEYERYGIYRQFKMFGQPVKETYSRKVVPSSGYWTDREINLRPLDFYEEVADLVLKPTYHQQFGGNSRDNRYFRDVIFEGEAGFNSVRYNKVLPLYGYGDWRRAAVFDPTRYGPRSRKHDLTNPIEISGITFVRGDVFLEGYYKGVGLLVVQGNVYLGGAVQALPKKLAGHPSFLNILVFEDPSREQAHFTSTDHASFKKTGHVIFKPHADNDWSEAGGEDPSPRMKIDPAIYTKNGVKTDKEAWRDYSANLGTFDIDLKHNLVTDTVNMKFLPHDLIINGIDPNDEFREAGGVELDDFLEPSISTVLKAWVVEIVDPATSLEDEEIL
ncbi:hypothetical protein HOF92_09830, partial [bacterium]|nr:hypothetical protein [bacterium]